MRIVRFLDPAGQAHWGRDLEDGRASRLRGDPLHDLEDLGEPLTKPVSTRCNPPHFGQDFQT